MAVELHHKWPPPALQGTYLIVDIALFYSMPQIRWQQIIG